MRFFWGACGVVSQPEKWDFVRVCCGPERLEIFCMQMNILFVVGDVSEEVLIPLVNASERMVNREINYTLMHGSEFTQRKEAGDPFVKNVMNERKIMITGTCDDRRPQEADQEAPSRPEKNS